METEVQHTLRNVEIRFTVHLIFTSFRHDRIVADERMQSNFELKFKKRNSVEGNFSWNNASFSIILFAIYLAGVRIEVFANWNF